MDQSMYVVTIPYRLNSAYVTLSIAGFGPGTDDSSCSVPKMVSPSRSVQFFPDQFG